MLYRCLNRNGDQGSTVGICFAIMGKEREARSNPRAKGEIQVLGTQRWYGVDVVREGKALQRKMMNMTKIWLGILSRLDPILHWQAQALSVQAT